MAEIVKTAVDDATQRSDASEPVSGVVEPCPVDLTLTIQRIREWAKNPKAVSANAQQGGTIGDFTLVKTGEKTPLVVGFTLEAAGPSSRTSGSDQRVAAATYSMIKNPGSKGPYRLVQTSQALATTTFGKRGLVNIHAGNNPVDLEGCICPGASWEERGEKPEQYPGVSSSRDKLTELKTAISTYGKIQSQTTYDGYETYSGSSYYCNVIVIIREIKTS